MDHGALMDTRQTQKQSSMAELLGAVSPQDLRLFVNERVHVLALPIALRKIFLEHRWPSRYKTIRHWLYIVAILNGICGIADDFISPVHDILYVNIARVFVTALLITCGLFFYRKRTIIAEGLLVVVPCSALMILAGCTTISVDPFLFQRLVMNACFVIASALVFLRVDFIYLCVIVAITSVSLTILVFVSDIPLEMTKVQIVVFHVCGLAAILNGQRIMMIHRYRGILIGFEHDTQARELADLNRKLKAMAGTDQLTGLANRRGLDEDRNGMAPDRMISKLMVDIDNFKRLNDAFGHAEGDRCLAAVADCIRANVRPGQFAGRFGGEEFLLILPDVTPGEAFLQADLLRKAVAALPHPPHHPITVSIGIARGSVEQHHSVRIAADEALYRAKALGKNRVEFASDDDLLRAKTLSGSELGRPLAA